VLGRGFSYALLKSVAAVDDRGLTGVSDPGHSFLDAALEKLADAELLFVEGVAPHANYRFKHALIQDAAYDSLLKSRRQTLHRRAAEVLLASPAPEAEALAHHFTLGGQSELAIEWWGKAGDQALRRSAFAEAISHLGKAIELSDKAGGAAKPREAAVTASASQRLKLQTEYSQAVMWGKGFAADETKDAFARAAELATRTDGPDASLDAYVARWVRSYFSGELGLALEAAERLLRGAERAARPTEAAAGHRLLGLTRLVQGDFAQAREDCEQALRIYEPERDREAKFRLGVDTRAMATAYLALLAWNRGEVSRAAALRDEAIAHAAECAHDPTIVGVYLHQAWLEVLRDDAEAAQRAAEAAVALSRERGLMSYLIWAALPLAWARAKIGDRDAGSAELRQALADYANQGNKFQLPFYRGLLAEIEAEGGDAAAALVGIDEALALAGETGEHWFDAGLHRIRGEILLKQNPADPAAAEAAFLAAIAVAQQQKARSFELRAALSLAKLYHSTGRPIDAHDVLGPALAGFSTTPEFPEIAEAKALFEALAGDETVKAEAARRTQRLKLQTDYGQAVMWSKGYAAEETKAAYARAGQLVTEKGASPSLDAYYARWGHYVFGGEIGSARETAESFLREAERAGRPTEVGIAHRLLGIALFLEGDFAQARAHCEQALRVYDPDRDRDAKFHLGTDSAAAAAAHVALTAWCGGDVARAMEYMDEAVARAIESAHAPTCALVYYAQCLLEMIREDAEATRRVAEASVALSREHGLSLFLAVGSMQSTWARAKLGDQDADPAEFRLALAEYASGGNRGVLQFHRALLAEIEAERGYMEVALAGIDGALALAGETGEHWFDAGLHRIRGEILLKQHPADPAAAEAAFLAAIAVAQHQKARSFELRAALSLAKLYQSMGRAIDAHDILCIALQGFAPTPELPAIGEAEQLVAELAQNDAVKAAVAARQQNVKLQVAYGNALMAARGHGDPATVAAFGRAHELAVGAETRAERSSIYYGRWSGAYVPGELDAMRELARAFLRDCESELNSGEACVALRINGVTKWFAGEFVEARDFFERALAAYDPERDRELVFRFGQDVGVPVLGYSALLLWALGEIALARERAEALTQRSRQSDNAATPSFGFMLSALYEIQRRNAAGAAASASSLKNVASAHGMAMWAGLAVALDGYVDWHAGNRARGLETLRRGLDVEHERGAAAFVPIVETALAEIEAEAGEIDAALGTISHAIAECERTQQRWFSAETHRIRGEILLKQHPADPAAAEAAFLAAIAVAQQQKARSFELRAALSLAKLYQSTGRPTDAHGVLGPALEGFSPTTEFPQIVEAIGFLAALEATGAQL
jgi:predicted ATPase